MALKPLKPSRLARNRRKQEQHRLQQALHRKAKALHALVLHLQLLP